MKRSKKVALITALILIGAGIVLGSVCTAITQGDFSMFSTTQYMELNHDVTSPFTSIRIEASDHDVHIIPSPDKGCHLTVITPKRDSVTSEFDRGTLVIEVCNHRAWYEHISLFNYRSPQIILALPEDSYENLGVQVGSGKIEVADGFTFDEVNLHTGSGNVFAANMHAENLFVDANSGKIELYNLNVENIMQLEASSGNITLSNVNSNGKIEAEVSSGRITCDTMTVAGTMDFSASSGNTELRNVQADGGIRAESNSGKIEFTNVITEGPMDLSTSSGSIVLEDCDAGELDISTSSGSVKGHLLTDKVFVCDTGSGSIHVPTSTTGGVCRIKTGSGSIRFE
ncbi:MAG: DUF4097 family beta strand repeat protein [Clostridia bacterium]|nr:DUF4097 family beta strand repeat protein [Clostridia bacterium]